MITEAVSAGFYHLQKRRPQNPDFDD